jgi:hypothetical protein
VVSRGRLELPYPQAAPLHGVERVRLSGRIFVLCERSGLIDRYGAQSISCESALLALYRASPRLASEPRTMTSPSAEHTFHFHFPRGALFQECLEEVKLILHAVLSCFSNPCPSSMPGSTF